MGEGVEVREECRERGQSDAGNRERPLGEILLRTPEVNPDESRNQGALYTGWRTVVVFSAVLVGAVLLPMSTISTTCSSRKGGSFTSTVPAALGLHPPGMDHPECDAAHTCVNLT